MSKFRQNPITKEWTIISPGRKKRPIAVGLKAASGECPFCPEPDSDWLIRVIPNKYPITDFHEVIIHSPDHEKDFDELPLEQVELILRTYKGRYSFYKEKRDDFYIHIYNNSGKEAGASLRHPHSQLVVFNQIPHDVSEEIAGAKDFFERKGACPYCDLIKKEISSQERVVIESELFLVLTPFQSEWPYEISILPKKHQADFGQLTDEELTNLAKILPRTLKAYKKVLANPAHNFWIHSLPIRAEEPEAQYYHWHLDLVPRIKTLGGLEMGAGIMVDDRVGPEEAARQLRESLS